MKPAFIYRWMGSWVGGGGGGGCNYVGVLYMYQRMAEGTLVYMSVCMCVCGGGGGGARIKPYEMSGKAST